MAETPDQTLYALYPLAVAHILDTYGDYSPEMVAFTHELDCAPDARAKAAVCAGWLRECKEYAQWMR